MSTSPSCMPIRPQGSILLKSSLLKCKRRLWGGGGWKKKRKAESTDAVRTKTCNHPSQFARFYLYKGDFPFPGLVLAFIEKYCKNSWCACAAIHFFKNKKCSQVVINTFQIANKVRWLKQIPSLPFNVILIFMPMFFILVNPRPLNPRPSPFH